MSTVAGHRKRGYVCIGLYQPKDALNIGSVLRAAGCFEANMVVVAGRRYRHAPTDVQKTWKHIPLIETELLESAMPSAAVAVAIELIEGARPLTTYTHPERAFYVFGGEDRTLGDDVLSWCRDRVYVPSAFCLNLAATVNVVLYDRLLKRAAKRGTATVARDKEWTTSPRTN